MGSWLILFPHSEPIWLYDRRSNNIHSIKTYFASSVNAIRPDAIAVAADVASKISIHPDFWSAVICGIGQISRLLPELYTRCLSPQENHLVSRGALPYFAEQVMVFGVLSLESFTITIIVKIIETLNLNVKTANTKQLSAPEKLPGLLRNRSIAYIL